MAVRLFISYSRRDAAFALALQEGLEQQGCAVWLDTHRLQTGQRWREEIVQAIGGCDYFVLLLSSWSIRSENVVKELSIAEGSGRPILPLMLGQVAIPDSMTYQLAGLQFVSVAADQPEAGTAALLAVLPRGAPAAAEGLWDKTTVLTRLQLAIGPIADLWLAPMADPLQHHDRAALEAHFERHRLDGAVLAEALVEARLPAAGRLDPSIGDWFRLQVGPIADLLWDAALQQALRQAPDQARRRLEQIGVDPAVVQQLLLRCRQV